MLRFVRRTDYTMRQIASMLTTVEDDQARQHGDCRCSGKRRPTGEIDRACGKYRRAKWNRRKVRAWLQRAGVDVKCAGPRSPATVGYEQLADIRRSMQRMDAEDAAERLSA